MMECDVQYLLGAMCSDGRCGHGDMVAGRIIAPPDFEVLLVSSLLAMTSARRAAKRGSCAV